MPDDNATHYAPHPPVTPRWPFHELPVTGTARTDHGRNHDPRRPGDPGNPIVPPHE